MYVYLRERENDAPRGYVYVVGHYRKSDGHFLPESDHETADSAAYRVHFLNGGSLSAVFEHFPQKQQVKMCTICGARPADTCRCQSVDFTVDEDGKVSRA